jgi:DNA-binding MarR family transcriptional regulator
MAYELDEQVGYMLRCAHQRATAIFLGVMADSGLTPTQFSVLVRLRQHGETSQNELGRLASMDPATVQGVIRRLSERDLIERRPDPNDGRRTLLRLSSIGRDLIDKAIPAGPAVSDTTLAPLDDGERREFLRLLKKLT